MEPLTVRTLLLVLYGAGLRVREALALNRADVDLNNSWLMVRRTKFYKTRLVPFGPQLRQDLAEYAERREAPAPPVGEGAPFLTTRQRTRVNQGTLEAIFQRVREQAGIRRADGARYQPRLHDLRHSAACRIMPLDPRSPVSPVPLAFPARLARRHNLDVLSFAGDQFNRKGEDACWRTSFQIVPS
jgi:integrase